MFQGNHYQISDQPHKNRGLLKSDFIYKRKQLTRLLQAGGLTLVIDRPFLCLRAVGAGGAASSSDNQSDTELRETSLFDPKESEGGEGD